MSKLNVKNIAGRLFPMFLLILFLLACSKNNKSELVLSLEEIFYNNNFTQIPDRVFNVADYGAIGDGKTLNTKSIQDAIDVAIKPGVVL